MENQITEIEQSIANEITVNSDGQGFITGRGLARLLGVAQSTISRASVNTRDAQTPGKIAEILMAQGFEPDAFPPYPDIALVEIATYYGYESKTKSEQARQVLKVLGAIGARTWMQKVKGWEAAPVQPPQPALPPAHIQAANFLEFCKFFELDMGNPRFSQALKDIAGNIVGLSPDQRQLTGEVDRWCGVAERAEELGYPVKQVTSQRSVLGKWVKKHFQGEPVREKRLCNGTMREIYLYPVGIDLDACIKTFFDLH